MSDHQQRLRLAAEVKEACIQAALDAYEDSGAQGLCEAGRFEAAISALQRIELEKLVSKAPDESL